MKRRAVLKRLGLASAAIVATPTVLSLLNSCTTEPKAWQPQFFNVEGGKVLQKMSDVFLPKTNLPSASELNIPEFIDKYIKDVYEQDEQILFQVAYDRVVLKLKEQTQKEVNDIKLKDLQGFLDENLKVKDEVDTERQSQPHYKGLTISECIDTLKWMCVDAYIHNEKIGEEVLAYDPVPGDYYCDDLESLTEGKRWSLSYI